MAKIELRKKVLAVFERARRWVKDNPKEAVLLFIILLTGAFLRLYKIDQYMTFLGDEGRDVIIVRRLLTEAHPPLIGPGTSIGNMYLGPIYYYMMAIPLFLANYSPVGPAVMVALLGVATIFFIWWVAKEWFGKKAAVLASLLYAISPTVIIYSRSSWNPNIMPFFALCAIYFMWRVWSKKELRLLSLVGISFAFTLQSHYLAFLSLPVVGVLWLLTFLNLRKDKKLKRSFIVNTVLSGIFFATLMSPLVIFDIRHNWQNFNAMKKFFTARQETVSIRPWNAIPNMYPQFENINTRLIAGRDLLVGKWTTIVVTITAFLLILTKREKLGSGFYLLLVWIGFALLGLGLYKQQIYDHYYGFIFAAPFLVIGVVSEILSKNKLTKVLLIVGFLILVTVNLQNSPISGPPNRQLARTIEVAHKIQDEGKGTKFNLAVIAERNYEDAYLYFLQVWGTGVVKIDPANTKDTLTKTLFVVCELPAQKCDPTHNPKAEVANFGWSKIENQWQVAGVVLYKLVHSR